MIGVSTLISEIQAQSNVRVDEHGEPEVGLPIPRGQVVVHLRSETKDGLTEQKVAACLLLRLIHALAVLMGLPLANHGLELFLSISIHSRLIHEDIVLLLLRDVRCCHLIDLQLRVLRFASRWRPMITRSRCLFLLDLSQSIRKLLCPRIDGRRNAFLDNDLLLRLIMRLVHQDHALVGRFWRVSAATAEGLAVASEQGEFIRFVEFEFRECYLLDDILDLRPCVLVDHALVLDGLDPARLRNIGATFRIGNQIEVECHLLVRSLVVVSRLGCFIVWWWCHLTIRLFLPYCQGGRLCLVNQKRASLILL